MWKCKVEISGQNPSAHEGDTSFSHNATTKMNVQISHNVEIITVAYQKKSSDGLVYVTNNKTWAHVNAKWLDFAIES
jgi:hypothetical protein